MKRVFVVDETGAEFDEFNIACAYLEENYGDSSETNESYPCFKGNRWAEVSASNDFSLLKNYCEFEEGLSISYF